MPTQHGLPAALAARGLAVELVPGWQTRGSAVFNPKGAVAHWTAGARTGDRGSLNICVNGRSGLPGPLCNVFLPRHSEVAIVVAAGRANHAGVGGYRGLVGNSSVFGTEAENSGNGEWTAWQRYAYPRINAAFADLGGFDAGMVCGHHEWTSRKPDPRDYTMDRMRAEVAAILATPTMTGDWFNMASAQDVADMRKIVSDETRDTLRKEGVTDGVGILLKVLTAEGNNFRWTVEQFKIMTDALAAQIAADDANDLDEEDVRRILADVATGQPDAAEQLTPTEEN